MNVRIKRAYDPPAREDGLRILVDRLWPRGMTKEKAKIDLWLKDIAPSSALRKWFGHDPGKWEEFRKRYVRELDSKPDLVKQIAEKAEDQPVTLVYGARDVQHNDAAVLLQHLQKHRVRQRS